MGNWISNKNSDHFRHSFHNLFRFWTSPKRHLIKRKIWHLADPPTGKKSYDNRVLKTKDTQKLEIYKQHKAIEDTFLLQKINFFQVNPKIRPRKISRLKRLYISDEFYILNLDYPLPKFFVAQMDVSWNTSKKNLYLVRSAFIRAYPKSWSYFNYQCLLSTPQKPLWNAAAHL